MQRRWVPALALDYPRFEVLFCVADGNDPVVGVVQALIAAHPEVSARLLVGEDRVSANPKLNNLEKGWQAARGEVIVMADSNLLLPRDYLWQLLAVRGAEVGLVSSPPVGIRPDGAWAELECAFLNSNQARVQLLADTLGFGFAQGKTLMWERAFLEARGGLAALGQRLAEDVAATRLVRGAGKRVALARRPFGQPIGRRSLGQVWARQLRWAKVRREGFPGLFAGEVLNGSVVALLAAGFGGGPVLLAGVAVVWYGAEAGLALGCGWLRAGAGAFDAAAARSDAAGGVGGKLWQYTDRMARPCDGTRCLAKDIGLTRWRQRQSGRCCRIRDWRSCSCWP